MWKFNETDTLPGNSLYHSADELYHYGIPGMKWKNHVYKSYDYGSVRNNIRGRMRNSIIRDTSKRISSDRKNLKKMESNLNWQQRNHASLKKNGGKIANSKLLSSIREHRMNQLKKKIGITKDSIKEDNQILKYQKSQEFKARNTAKNKVAAKNILKEAKAKYKQSQKQYNKDFDNYAKNAWYTSKEAAQVGAGIVLNSARKANKAKDNYKKAKSDYKKLKKNW